MNQIQSLKYSLLLFLFFSNSIVSQNATEILARIVDVQTNYPVSFATIRFENENRGVIADEEGGFRLPLDFKITNKRVIISSIGFENLTLPVESLQTDIINTIYLKPKVEELSAVVITATKDSNNRKLSPETIVKNAIGRIPANYPYNAHSYITYYRDYQLINNNYYNLNEAILESFDAGFNTNKLLSNNNASVLYSYNLNEKYFQDSLLLNSIYGKSKMFDRYNTVKLGTAIQNELEILNIHNPIRNFNMSSFSFIYVFKDDFLTNHNFKFSKLVYANNIPLYEIEFVSKNADDSKYIGQGKIYISKSTYAIQKLEYRMLDKGSNAARGNPFGNSSSKITVNDETILFEVNVEYKDINGKMYLNYMTFNNRFVIKEPNPFVLDDFTFNTKNKKFYLKFNKPLDKSSINRKSNIRLRYRNKKLILKSIDIVDDMTLMVEAISWSAGMQNDIKLVKPEDFTYRLKRIKDITGGEINKQESLTGYQFRELYVQEVFPNKNPVIGFYYVDKTLPLFKSKLNKPNFDISTYWVNSPLKRTKNSN